MLSVEPATDFPAYLDMDMRAFRKYKDGWLLWRSIGSYDSSGSFIPPVSYKEAREMSKEELDIYLELDRLLSIRQKQVHKQ